MSFLKGNYDMKKKVGGPKDAKKESSSTEEFEKFARTRLGGSIAFVMKDNTFVWDGDDKSGPAKETKK